MPSANLTVLPRALMDSSFPGPTINPAMTSNGWNQPSTPPGRSPALSNCLAMYSAARSSSGDPLARPRISSEERNWRCVRRLSVEMAGASAAASPSPHTATSATATDDRMSRS